VQDVAVEITEFDVVPAKLKPEYPLGIHIVDPTARFAELILGFAFAL